MRKMRVGFIGTGGYGQFIMRLTRETGLADIVAVWNRTAAKAEKVAEEYGAKAYASCEEMYDQADLDAVFINLPPFARNGEEIMAAEKGIHLYVTKPLTVDWNYACKVNEAVKKSGVVSCVTHMMRYAKPVIEAQKMLAGRPVSLAQGHMFTSAINAIDKRGWFFKKDKSPGQLFTQACHVIDALRFVVGSEIEEVYAIGSNNIYPKNEKCEIDESTVATLKFSNGAVGYVTASFVMPSGLGHYMHFDVLAKDVRVEYTLDSGIMNILDKDGWREFPEISKDHAANKNKVEIFLKAVQSGDSSLITTPYEDSIKSLQVAFMMIRSLEEGRVVKASEM